MRFLCVPTFNVFSRNKKNITFFSFENLHFYSLEILLYIALECLRNGCKTFAFKYTCCSNYGKCTVSHDVALKIDDGLIVKLDWNLAIRKPQATSG